MKKFELSWRDFKGEEGDGKRIVEYAAVIFFFYFLLSLVSFWQYLAGEVPYSAFWHAPWRLLIGLFL